MRFRIALGLLAVAVGTQPVWAQGAGDAAAGRALASGLCAPCHRISGGDRDASRVPPDFGAVAAMPSMSELSLRVFLRTPHGNMPRYQLTSTETDDIIAYLLGLRER